MDVTLTQLLQNTIDLVRENEQLKQALKLASEELEKLRAKKD